MDSLVQDLKYALRGIARAPVFTLGVVATLALGIGANTTMFGVVDALFLRAPAGVRDADGIVRLYIRRYGYTGATMSFPSYVDLRDHVDAFASVAAVTRRSFSLGRGTDAEQTVGAAVSHQFFPMLGLTPTLGRFFGPDEDKVGGERVAVISHGYWQRKFAGAANVLGRTLQIGRGTYTVIGVAPEGFTGVELEPTYIYLPIHVAATEIASDAITSRGAWTQAVARLKDGVSPDVAIAQATTAFRTGQTEGGRLDSTSVAVLGPLHLARGPEASDDSKVSAWIGFVSLAVLLIACANVANLLLARATNRRRELALRAGLGAGRRGLVRMLLVECLVLASLGGGAALLMAAWFGRLLRNFLLPGLPADTQLLDARVLLFTAAAVIATTLLAGLVPAFQASRTDLAEALKAGGHGTTTRTGRTRTVLLSAQVALTLVLLVGAGLFVRSLRNVQRIDRGFDSDRIIYLAMDLDALGSSREADNQTYLRLMERIQNLAGVEHAAASMGTPFNFAYSTLIEAEGVGSIPNAEGGGPYYNGVTGDYFATMGMRVLRGRDFTAGDVTGAPLVAIVNETFARLVWPNQDPIGRCLYVGDAAQPGNRVCTQVVGLAEDAKRGSITEREPFQYYLPYAQVSGPHINALLIRSRTAASDVRGALAREVRSAGNLPYADIQSLAELEEPQMRSWRLGATAFSAFGVLALLIAATGVVAVLSYTVGQRTKEIGVRIALGAQAADVLRLVVGQGLRAATIGVLAGGAGALALGQGVATLLYSVKPTDPAVFGVTAATLLGVAALAAFVPARRAARIDPMEALRAE